MAQGEKPPRYDGLIWTSVDGTDWSEPEVIKGAELDDIDSAGDALVIAGGLVSNLGTSMDYLSPSIHRGLDLEGRWPVAGGSGRGQGRACRKSVAVSADGVYLFSGHMDGTLRLSDHGERFGMLRSPMVNVDGAGAAGSWRPARMASRW